MSAKPEVELIFSIVANFRLMSNIYQTITQLTILCLNRRRSWSYKLNTKYLMLSLHLVWTLGRSDRFAIQSALFFISDFCLGSQQ